MNALNYHKAGRGLLLHQSGDSLSFAADVETIEQKEQAMPDAPLTLRDCAEIALEFLTLSAFCATLTVWLIAL